MVSALMISTLAGVCRRVRLRRLPLPAVWFNVSVGAAGDAGTVVDGTAAAAAAARFFPPRINREAVELFDWRGLAVGVGLVTTTGSSVRLACGAPCDHASSGQRTEERATEYSKDVRRDAQWETEFMVRLAVNVARHRERSLPTARFGRGSATTRTPRPMCSRVTTTGGRSPGSRVTAFRRLPGYDPSGN
jgi:hypothetical protein